MLFRSTHQLGNSKMDSFESLDKEIERHMDMIVSLRKRRNSLCPISRLPAEILFMIFRSLQVVNPENSFCSDRKWIAVTHVCSAWRTVALNCPILWSRISSFKQEAMVEAFLERSKESPLDVRLDVRENGISEAKNLERVLLCLARIRVLEIVGIGLVGRSNGILNVIKDALAKPAPILKEFTYSMPTQVQYASFLSATLFDNQAPRLEHFHVRRGRFTWNPNILGGLTSLCLADILLEDIPDPLTLLRILDHCPNLENLELVGLELLNERAESISMQNCQIGRAHV